MVQWVWQRTKTSFQLVREEVEDIIAEAQFERMKKQMDQEMDLEWEKCKE